MKKLLKCAALAISAATLLSVGASAVGREGKIGDSVKMTARIENIGEKIEVTVLESEYTSGPHWVITPPETKYFDARGREISREELRVGDTVEILYSGQVMLSYPPQIVAARLTLVEDKK